MLQPTPALRCSVPYTHTGLRPRLMPSEFPMMQRQNTWSKDTFGLLASTYSSYFMSHPVALWHIHALEIIFIKSQLHFMKVIQARESTPRQNSCFVKLSMWCLENQLCIYPLVDRWTNKMQEWGSTNALQACPLVRLGSDLINAFKWGNRRTKLRGSEGIGRKASQMLWSAEQIEKRLTERTSRFPV